MNPFWSQLARELSPYVPGEQPRVANLVKLNTNESPFGPSPLAIEAMRNAAADALRLYPDPEATELREALAAHHAVSPEQVFVGNGSDEVLAHAFAALLKQPKPLLFPDVTYSFYPVWAQLFGVACETVPLDDGMRVRVEDYRRAAGSIVIANPNAPTGIALPRAEIVRLLDEHPDIPVLIDEAYVDFGGESTVPLIADHPNLLVVQTMSKSRGLAGLRVGYALGDVGLIEALRRVKDSFNSYPLGRVAQAGATASVRDDEFFRESGAKIVAGREAMTQELIRLGFVVLPSSANFVFARHPARSGTELAAALRDHAVLVRHFNKPRTEPYLRITVGTDDDTRRLIAAAEDILRRNSR
jgi:histidinol-phosphate aminotransferase